MGDWTKVASRSEIPVGGAAKFAVGERTVAIADIGGTLHAVDDRCSHRGCSLAEGSVDGSSLVCPCHGAAFDLATGQALSGPATEALSVVAVREVDGSIEVSLG